MSLASQVQNLATAVGTRSKANRTLINGNLADLAALTTTAKGNLVAAVNEVNAKPTGAAIADGVTALATTWSSQKITDANAALKADILGGAAAAQDTLLELKTYVDSGNAADLTALANRLRIDAAQGLTAPQRVFGRDNLDVYSRAEVGDPATDFVAAFNAALV